MGWNRRLRFGRRKSSSRWSLTGCWTASSTTRWPPALPGFLPEDVSIDITSVDLTAIRDQMRTSVAGPLHEVGVPVNPNDPVINAILARYTEALNGHFQRDALQLETYIWRSQDDARVRPAHAENDDRVSERARRDEALRPEIRRVRASRPRPMC